MRARQDFDHHDLEEPFDAPLEAPGTEYQRELRRILLVLLCLSFACLALAASNLILVAFIKAPQAALKRESSPRVAFAEERVSGVTTGEKRSGASASVADSPRPEQKPSGVAEAISKTPAARSAAPSVVDSPRVPPVTERRSPKAQSPVELPQRPAVAAGVTTATIESSSAGDPSERTAQWLIDMHGRSFAEERAQEAAAFYRPGEPSAQFWKNVLRHIREVE